MSSHQPGTATAVLVDALTGTIDDASFAQAMAEIGQTLPEPTVENVRQLTSPSLRARLTRIAAVRRSIAAAGLVLTGAGVVIPAGTAAAAGSSQDPVATRPQAAATAGSPMNPVQARKVFVTGTQISQAPRPGQSDQKPEKKLDDALKDAGETLAGIAEALSAGGTGADVASGTTPLSVADIADALTRAYDNGSGRHGVDWLAGHRGQLKNALDASPDITSVDTRTATDPDSSLTGQGVLGDVVQSLAVGLANDPEFLDALLDRIDAWHAGRHQPAPQPYTRAIDTLWQQLRSHNPASDPGFTLSDDAGWNNIDADLARTAEAFGDHTGRLATLAAAYDADDPTLAGLTLNPDTLKTLLFAVTERAMYQERSPRREERRALDPTDRVTVIRVNRPQPSQMYDWNGDPTSRTPLADW